MKGILEMKLWEVPKTSKYPDAIKYSLIFINPTNGKKILMDNHIPKGHHYHLDDQEFDYQYRDIPQLVDDFKSLVKIHMGATL